MRIYKLLIIRKKEFIIKDTNKPYLLINKIPKSHHLTEKKERVLLYLSKLEDEIRQDKLYKSLEISHTGIYSIIKIFEGLKIVKVRKHGMYRFIKLIKKYKNGN